MGELVTSLTISPDILSCWDLDPILSIHVLPPRESSAGESVAFVQTVTGGRFVLKRETVRRALQSEYGLLKALAASGVPVSVPLLARSGEPYVHVGDETYNLSPQLPGAVYTDHYAPGAEGRARQFGVAIAQLHVALRGCNQIVRMPDMDLPGDVQRCSPVVCSIWPVSQRPPGPILDEIEAGLAHCFTMLPQQLLHRDTHPGNMLFQGGQLTGWIDFELMERGPRLFDLCYCSTSLLMNGLDDPAKRQAWNGLVCALAVIALLDGTPLGWVSRYGEERSPDTWMIGIDICEDDRLERVLGTEALGLWVDYLFKNSTVHRIGLDTWSFNPRMTRVAEKLGFTPEGAQCEVLQWHGEWLDLVHFGMLRKEWEKR